MSLDIISTNGHKFILIMDHVYIFKMFIHLARKNIQPYILKHHNIDYN